MFLRKFQRKQPHWLCRNRRTIPSELHPGEPLRLASLHRPPREGNGFELARKAREHQSDLKVVMLAPGDAIPIEHSNAARLEAVVAEADIIEDRKTP